MFHVSLIEQYRSDGRCQPPPPTLFLDGDEQYDIDSALAVRQSSHRKREFLVKWLGYGPEHNTWKPEGNLTNGSEVLQAFWDSQSLPNSGTAKNQQDG